MWRSPNRKRSLPIAYAAASVLAASSSGFLVDRNDFWALAQLARQVDLHAPATLHNGLYPFGYPLVLALLGPNPALPALFLSIGCGGVLIAAAYGLARLVVGAPWAFAAALMLGLQPQVVRYATTASPDVVVAALAAAGFSAIVRAARADAPESRRSEWLGGILFGLAALLRYHALVLAAAAIGAGWLIRTRPKRLPWRVCLAVAAIYALQVVVNAAAGLGPLATAQSFNVYKLVHGVNWFHVDPSMATGSIADVIRASPGKFASAWVQALVPSLLLLVPSFLLALFPGVPGRLGRFAAITIGLYLPVVTMGSSSRADLPVLVLVATSAIALADQIWRRRRSLSSFSPPLHGLVVLAVAVGVLASARAFLRQDYGLVKHRQDTANLYRRVEARLVAGGVTQSTQVFASDLSLYFRNLPGHTPWTNGSWLRVDGGRYSEEFPELCVSSIGCFERDAAKYGITHLVLTPEAPQLSPAMGALFEETAACTCEALGSEGVFRLYRLK
jgi:4-amino-4-deoxy-L-arabinose transferase-like glycosyltransferase